MGVKHLAWLTILLLGCTPATESSKPPLPNMTSYSPIRNVGNFGPVVTDIESHLPAGHPYRDFDRITWVHEGTHGINSQLRNQYQRPGFYVLNDKAILLKEPGTTLANVAAAVPVSLRGSVYHLYLIQQQTQFNEQPTYVLDEWVAYTNGSEARRVLGVAARGETVEVMLEFIPYALTLARTPNDPQMKAFIRWQIERSVQLAGRPPTMAAPDAKGLRQFTRNYLGVEWTRCILQF